MCSSGSQDLTPDGYSVASYVHEYGGGAWAAADGVAWFSNAEDQRVHQVAAGEVTPVSPAGAAPGAVRHAGLSVHPGGRWLWAVRERREPDQVVNEIVRIPAAPEAAPVVVASGWDFYSFPAAELGWPVADVDVLERAADAMGRDLATCGARGCGWRLV